MPRKLRDFVPVIFEELLPSYKSTAGTEAALTRMSRRVRRPNPLAEGGGELTRHYEELKTDFERFIVAAQRFSTASMEMEVTDEDRFCRTRNHGERDGEKPGNGRLSGDGLEPVGR